MRKLSYFTQHLPTVIGQKKADGTGLHPYRLEGSQACKFRTTRRCWTDTNAKCLRGTEERVFGRFSPLEKTTKAAVKHGPRWAGTPRPGNTRAEAQETEHWGPKTQSAAGDRGQLGEKGREGPGLKGLEYWEHRWRSRKVVQGGRHPQSILKLLPLKAHRRQLRISESSLE